MAYPAPTVRLEFKTVPRFSPSNYSIRGFRRALASIDSAPQFALLGVLSGAVTGLVILAFRTLMELPLASVMEGDPENFEALHPLIALLLPISGSFTLMLMFLMVSKDGWRVGVVHVLERLARHQGYLTWKNFLVQFFGGIIALGTGHSGGREGPAIHLGAAGTSLLGQVLKLPNNSIRILVGCGAAAAISASFNTPLAGVIFSMEVILMEYTIAGFIPVILSAATATLIIQAVYGNGAAFSMPHDAAMSSFYDIPFLILEGIVLGVIAAAFVKSTKMFFYISPPAMWLRLLTLGVSVGVIGMFLPEILGVGYDTVDAALAGELTVTLLFFACILKLLTSSASIAFGLPVGTIGPTLFIGATAGGLFAALGNEILPQLSSSPAFYVVIGMGAMMGAALQAPLAAVLAVLELTQNTNVVLPAMLVIIIANMTAREIFGIKSIFITQMEYLGLEFRQNPVTMALNRASVASIMSRSFERVRRQLSIEDARKLASAKPTWLLVEEDTRNPTFVLPTIDLITYLEANKQVEEVDLKAIPATRRDVSSILLQATLTEALDLINSSGHEAIYVNRISAPMTDSVVGIVTRQDIENFYQA